MSHPDALKRINAEISSHFGHLSNSLIYGLSLYVLGTTLLRHCGQTQVATLLSGMLGCKFGTMKQRLRELTYESSQKRGENRQSLEVDGCFAPLLGWVLSKFKGDHHQVVLALDVTYLQDRFRILSVSVVVAGCAIPVAWRIQHSHQTGEWNPIWLELITSLAPAIPPEWCVFVLTDSGLYSKTLYQALTDRFHWQVFMRIVGTQGLFMPHGGGWIPLRELVKRGMTPLTMSGRCFKGNPLSCTLVLQWDADYEHPCLIVTNVPPPDVNPNIYAIRYWIECGFKDIKRGLLHWEQTKMTCPQRAERLWLVISIALLWLTTQGERAAEHPRWQSLRRARPNSRILSAPMLGWIDLILTLVQGQPLAFGSFQPYPWVPIPDH